MKKNFLILLALVAALTLVFVACENDATTETDPVTEAPTTEATEAPTEEVTEPTTDEPTEAPTDDATEAPTDADTEAPTEEVTTEEVTDAPTEPPRFNSWDDKSVVAHLSFDQLYTGTGDSSTGTQIFSPGGVAGWDYVADLTAMSEQYLTVWGWIGAVDATFGTFGYAINDAEAIFSADYAVTPEGPVVEAAAAMGGASASRMKIAVDLAGLYGENTVYVLYKDANETVVALATFTVIMNDTVIVEDYVEGNPSNMSICCDNVRTWVGDQYTDLCTQEAHLYMNGVEGKITIDAGVEYVSFRGWANPTVGGIEIAQFGYKIGDGPAVFSDSFWQDEPELNAALNSVVAKRYENIMVPVADLEAGSYEITLLVRDTEGLVYVMNVTWGNITIVKA